MVVPNSGARRGGVPTEKAVITADGCLLLWPRLQLEYASIRSMNNAYTEMRKKSRRVAKLLIILLLLLLLLGMLPQLRRRLPLPLPLPRPRLKHYYYYYYYSCYYYYYYYYASVVPQKGYNDHNHDDNDRYVHASDSCDKVPVDPRTVSQSGHGRVWLTFLSQP